MGKTGLFLFHFRSFFNTMTNILQPLTINGKKCRWCAGTAGWYLGADESTDLWPPPIYYLNAPNL